MKYGRLTSEMVEAVIIDQGHAIAGRSTVPIEDGADNS